jgi:hypothetical protein
MLGLAMALASPVIGCGSGSDSEKAADLKQEANTKSLQATGDYYRQKYQQQKKK